MAKARENRSQQGCQSMKDFCYEDHIGLWKNELADFMPDRFFDVHEHIGPESIMGEISEARKKVALTTYVGLEWEELLKLYKDMYAGKEAAYVCAFGFPIHEVDIYAANAYVLEKAKEDRRLLPLLLASPRDPDALERGYAMARQLGVRVYGVKPYFDFAVKEEEVFTARDVELEEFVTPDMLEFCDRHQAVLMLHTCGIGMGDPALRKKVGTILEQYPDLKLILAHMGRFYVKEQFFDFVDSGFMEKYRDKNVWFDVSSVTDPDVFHLIFSREEFYSRLLYAQDQPYGLIPGVEMFSQTMGGIFLTREQYPWSDPAMLEEFAAERENLTYNNYHCMKAIKDAIAANIPDPVQAKSLIEDLFYNNAMKLFQPPSVV